MKIYKKYIISGLIGLSLNLSSCDKWLDVAPQTQIEADRVFKKESGFQDALTGVYIKMTSESLYGRELTFGMVDGLGGQFNGLTSTNQYYSTIMYDFDEVNFVNKSQALFENAYNAIANLNTLIENIDESEEGLFSGVNYHTIRGEAYGLRALLHFDLVRLYGSAIASNGKNASALPYIDAVGIVPKERLTTSAFLKKITADLDIAANELKSYDPIVPGNEANSSTYLRDRSLKLNYYAVKALQARVHLYDGDNTKALEAAREVIESNVFEWTPSSEIATTNDNNKNKIFTQELIFNLNINGMGTITSPFFDIGVSGSLLAKYPYEYDAYFDPVDYRYNYLTVDVPSLYKRYSSKLVQEVNSATAFINRMPMIRKSEMYYIAAECLAETDPVQALAYLNEVRQHRNIGNLAFDLTTTQINAEILLEYRREFIGEGQLFFYYKRKNSSQIDDVNVTMNDGTYVLPLPDREISYGQ